MRAARIAVAALAAGGLAGVPATAPANVIGLPAGADRLLAGGQDTFRVGAGVSSAGDFDADGREDWIVGGFAPGPRAWIVSGGDRPDVMTARPSSFGAAGTTIVGGGGWYVSSAGDFNGDGIADVVVGSQRTSSNGVLSDSAVTIVLGAKRSGGVVDLNAPPPGRTMKIGGLTTTSLASAGDVNGDGLTDVVVGATEGGAGRGTAYVILGRREMEDVPSFSAALSAGIVLLVGKNGAPDAQTPGDLVGSSVAGIGDVDGDGFGDLAVGARGVKGSDGRAPDGAVFVVFGSAQPTSLVLDPAGVDPGRGYVLRAPDRSFGALGGAVSAVGDLTEDGLPEFAVAAPDAGPSYRGRVWVVRGGRRAGLVSVADPAARAMELAGPPSAPPTPYEFFGYRLAGLGDVTGDRRADLAISTAGPARRVFVVYGAGGATLELGADRALPIGTGVVVATPSPGQKSDRFGHGVARVGGALLVGAPSDHPLQEAAYLVPLQPGAAASPPPAPVRIEQLALKKRTFRAGTGAGTLLRVRLSAPARLRMAVFRAPTRQRCDATRSPAVLRACVPQLEPVGILDLGRRGTRRTDLRFTGRVRGPRGAALTLTPGRYVGRVQAADGERVSVVRPVTFTIAG